MVNFVSGDIYHLPFTIYHSPFISYLTPKFQGMKSIIQLLFILIATSFIACGGEGSTTTNDPATQDSTDTNPPADTTSGGTTDAPVKPNCTIPGKVLETNQMWLREENLVIAIVADKETEDPNLGESHRILLVFDGKTCQQVMKEILPVNTSPDYPYYLSQITYNNVNKVVAIRGFDKVYVFDLASRKLMPTLVPKFLNKRLVDDAASGSIARLELWENYLIGHAASMGAFVFDLSNPQSPQAVLPFAEFELEKNTRYNSLFMLKSFDAANGNQALMPSFDPETEEFSLNPLFEKPRKIDMQLNRQFKNNKYLVLKENVSPTESRPVAIDMSKKKLVELPAEVAAKKDTDIIEWMKKN